MLRVPLTAVFQCPAFWLAWKQICAIEAAFAMNARRKPGRSAYWLLRSGDNINFRFAYRFKHSQSVRSCPRQWCVAMDSGNSEKLKRGMIGGKQNGTSILINVRPWLMLRRGWWSVKRYVPTSCPACPLSGYYSDSYSQYTYLDLGRCQLRHALLHLNGSTSIPQSSHNGILPELDIVEHRAGNY
jgi:hypothetical protein